jgi:Rha family phage regulatory protein
MNNLTIINHNGQPVADSREVAEVTGKQHAHLMRDIKGYKEIIDPNPNLDSAQFFIESEYIDSQNQPRPCYLLTRKGCDMVANKMTGEKGVIFTATYVTKFDEMEKQIQLPRQLSAMEQLKLQYEVLEIHNKQIEEANSRLDKLENTMTIDYSQQEEIKTKVAMKVINILGGADAPAYKELGKKAFSLIWRDFKRVLDVNSYRNTSVKEFNNALNFIATWKPTRELELMIMGSNSQIRL